MLHIDEEKVTVAERMSAFIELHNQCKRNYEGQFADLLIQHLIVNIAHAKASFIKKHAIIALTENDIENFKKLSEYMPNQVRSDNDLFIWLAEAYSTHNVTFLLKTFYLKYQEALPCYGRSHWNKKNLSWAPVLEHAIHSRTLFFNPNRTKKILIEMGIINSKNQLLTNKYSTLTDAYQIVQEKKVER